MPFKPLLQLPIITWFNMVLFFVLALFVKDGVVCGDAVKFKWAMMTTFESSDVVEPNPLH